MDKENFASFEPFPGFEDRFGHSLQLMLLLENKLFELFRLFGYEQVEIPILERKNFFHKKYLGDSPWPGWDEKCLFEVNVADYSKDYKEVTRYEKGALVPEGTTSICRWLSNQTITKRGELNKILPLRLYYLISCFRNEPVSDLSQRKSREFKQVGLELFGPRSEMADVEVLYLVTKGLETIGIPKSRVIIRIGDVRILNQLSKIYSLKKSHEIALKEKLDKLAELKALKKEREVIQLQNEINFYLRKIGVPYSGLKLWNKLYSADTSNWSLKEALSVIVDDLKNKEVASSLQLIGEMLNFLEIPFKIDLCVVRSQEYYSGPVFEIDIQGRDAFYLEVAGGGRYNQLISRFLKNDDISIPATGFAYGLERILNAVKNEDLRIFNPEVKFFLDGKSIDYVIFPKDIKRAWKTAEKMRGEWKRTSLYLLDDNKKNAEGYAKRKGAIFLEV